MVGRSDVLNQAISVIGNAQQKLLQVQMLPVFIGIGLGGTRWFDSILYSRFPCCVKIRACWRAIGGCVDFSENWHDW